MRWAENIHDFLKWMWPALGGIGGAVVASALAASEIWPEAKDWTAARYLDLVSIVGNPWAWIAFIAIFLVWLLALIWSAKSANRSEGAPRSSAIPAAPTELESPSSSQSVSAEARQVVASGVPADGKYTVGGRVEDQRASLIGPLPTAEGLRALRDSPDYVPIEDAGRWLYENGNERIREVLRAGVPDPFKSIGAHGAAFFRTLWAEGKCQLYARWETSLSLEPIDYKDGDFSAFESVFGSDRRQPIDWSVRRQDMPPVLDYYERDEPLPSRGVAKVVRDTSLSEALMYLATRRWGLDPLADGGGHLNALGTALDDFRQRAHDGEVTVWGRAGNYGVWQRINPDYWIDHRVDLLDVLRAEVRSRAINQMSQDPLFSALMVCRAEFAAAWDD
jgi:hypothetical protein